MVAVLLSATFVLLPGLSGRTVEEIKQVLLGLAAIALSAIPVAAQKSATPEPGTLIT